MMNKLLKIKNLYVDYKTNESILGQKSTIYALNGVSFDVNKGEVFAIAGESGCGKSTLAKTIMNLQNKVSGEILYNNDIIDKNFLSEFPKHVQMIFQNPYASLNPKMKIYDILKEPLTINTEFSVKEIDEKVNQIVSKVGLENSCLNLYPHEFSGGQRQRIAIARALILEPELIIADEPVSALDVSIQAQIINLLLNLKNDYNLTIIFISHDLSVIKCIADRIAIMYLGEIVECGLIDEIFNDPKHPYTKALLSAAPKICDNEDKKLLLTGDLPSHEDLPNGCKFHTRCSFCMDICKNSSPEITKFSSTHYANCFLHNNQNL